MVDNPHAPAPYDRAVLNAVRAFMEGKANEGQQITVRDWLLHLVCRVDDMSYRPGADGDRATVFAEGKRYVANQLRKMQHPVTLQALDKHERAPDETTRRHRSKEAR